MHRVYDEGIIYIYKERLYHVTNVEGRVAGGYKRGSAGYY